jgi:hypothetical protein
MAALSDRDAAKPSSVGGHPCAERMRDLVRRATYRDGPLWATRGCNALSASPRIKRTYLSGQLRCESCRHDYSCPATTFPSQTHHALVSSRQLRVSVPRKLHCRLLEYRRGETRSVSVSPSWAERIRYGCSRADSRSVGLLHQTPKGRSMNLSPDQCFEPTRSKHARLNMALCVYTIGTHAGAHA